MLEFGVWVGDLSLFRQQVTIQIEVWFRFDTFT